MAALTRDGVVPWQAGGRDIVQEDSRKSSGDDDDDGDVFVVLAAAVEIRPKREAARTKRSLADVVEAGSLLFLRRLTSS